MSATALSVIAVHYWYNYYKRAKARMERFFRMLAKKPPEGKYYRLKSIHGELPVRRRAPPQPTPPEGFMGYVKTPEGWKIKTPFFEIPVEKIPQTADSVLTVHERPIRAFLTTIDLASPTFRQEISKAFERVRRIRELIRL